MLKRSWWLFLTAILISTIAVCACGGGDDGDETDGDSEQLEDGDDARTDGDEAEADGDAMEADGDEEDPGLQMCTPQPGGMCFGIDSIDLAGQYDYVEHDALVSGCSLDDGTLQIIFYDAADGWAFIEIRIADYDEAGVYDASTHDVIVSWTYMLNSVDKPRNFRSTNPCTVTVDDWAHGSISCSFYDVTDAGVYFKMLGAWACNQ